MVRLALVVDAEPAVHEILRRALGPAGIEDLIPSSNAEAAGHLQATRFELVFVDLRSSPLHGVELTARIRQPGLNRTTPIILISGEQTKGELSRGFSAGANFYVHMPIDTGRLTKLIVHITAVEQRARRFRRVPEHMRVQLASEQLQLEGETVDISLGGMLVRVPRTFPIGTLLELSLYLPAADKPIIGLGLVMRVKGSNEMGIKIDRIAVEESERLQDYLLRVCAA